MKRNVIFAVALAIAVALAGCSKGEDGTENNNNMDDVKEITADIRKHIVGKWVCDGHFGGSFPTLNGNTATATFDYTNERDYDNEKDVVQFFSDGKLLITPEGETEPLQASYEVPEPDTSAAIYFVAKINIIIPSEYGYIRIGSMKNVLFEPGYDTMCLLKTGDFWRYRRIKQ